MTGKLLMIAYHFPPLVGSSGVHRSLNFARDLPQHGWQPLVMSVHPRAYAATSDEQLGQLPRDLQVLRTFALDASRHLSLKGRYPGWLARPDRWLTWWLSAVPAGLALIRRERPRALWSTYPIPTAHLIGRTLAQLSGLPWIADFRDPMAHDGYPQERALWDSYLTVEGKIFARADCMVFTTEGAARLYRDRYPARASDVSVIPNGYDEAAFQKLAPTPQTPLNPGCCTLLHSGIVYPEWRNPSGLFRAIQALVAAGQLHAGQLKIRFRAPVHETWLHALADRHSLREFVEILPPVSYEEALQEMLAADVLLALQSDDCSDQIPAKVYEYIRAGRPVLGLAHPASDAGRLLVSAGMGPVCGLDDEKQIMAHLLSMLKAHREDTPVSPNSALVQASSRQAAAISLAKLLDEITLNPSSRRPLKPSRAPHHHS